MGGPLLVVRVGEGRGERGSRLGEGEMGQLCQAEREKGGEGKGKKKGRERGVGLSRKDRGRKT